MTFQFFLVLSIDSGLYLKIFFKTGIFVLTFSNLSACFLPRSDLNFPNILYIINNTNQAFKTNIIVNPIIFQYT